MLGGSSVLNYMLYVRASPHDYDDWEAAGNYGWSWKDVFPYFLKSEDNRDPTFLKNGKLKNTHERNNKKTIAVYGWLEVYHQGTAHNALKVAPFWVIVNSSEPQSLHE